MECRQIAELLGDYLDGSLPRETRELTDFHVDGCPPCVAFLNTYRGTVDAARKLPEEADFRQWKAQPMKR